MILPMWMQLDIGRPRHHDAGKLGDGPISYARVEAIPRRASRWTLALAMMVVHAQGGHAAQRHATVTPRARIRATSAHATKTPDPSEQLGDDIIAFARQAEGREVGDGECFSLADQALTHAGARSAADYTEITPDGDYVWGTPVSLDAARPGDILQFRNFHILRRVTTTTRSADGTISSMQSEDMEERDHHTAIVTANLGVSLAILEQNVEPLGRIVQRNTIEIASGTWRDTNATTDTMTQVSVDGYIGAYRPQKIQAISIADTTRSGD